MQEKLQQIENRLFELYPDYKKEIYNSTQTRYEIDTFLYRKGYLFENELLEIYSEIFQIPLKYDLDIDKMDNSLNISNDFLVYNVCFPTKIDSFKIDMLISNPYEMGKLEYIFKSMYNREINFTLTKRSNIEHLLSEKKSDIESDSAEDIETYDEHSLRNLAGEAQVIKDVNEMLNRASELKASDIHIEPEDKRFVIRFRVDGIIQEYLSLPLKKFPPIASRIKLIAGLNIAERRLPQDGRTNYQLGKDEIDIRVSTIPVMNGESIVMRLLQKDTMEYDLEKIGMDKNIKNQFENLIKRPHGIILVVGPTGSGKTTTLYSSIATLNDKSKKIITIEDPVEYKMEGLSQMQVNHKIGLTFSSGLRNIVRQDPDIILVGEIRDKETADIAINAALTGHLVFSTLHTNDAVGAITRLLDMGVENFLLSSSVVAVLSQRLVRKVCDECNGEDDNCRNCSGSGYKGRIPIFELLTIDDAIRKAVIAELDSEEINKIAIENGMVPLLENGMKKVMEGETTETEISRISN